MTYLPRAATSGELIKLRSSHWCNLRAAVITGAIVFQARVNQTFTTTDSVTQLTFDTVTLGAYTDIVEGMTLWLGSAAGLYDIGQARIRKAATSTIVYIGEESELAVADNLYITVVKDYALWPKPLRVLADGTVYVDYDITYSDQNTNHSPIPVMGPHNIKKLTGATVATAWDASSSWCSGSSITGYVWTAPGASATSGLTTATPTLTYNAAGTYLVSLTVTAANGKTNTGWRYVYVYSDATPASKVTLNSCSGNYQNGGWEFGIRMLEGADTSTIRDRALVILFAEDYYGGTLGSVGYVGDRENIVCVGWISGESIQRNTTGGYVEFTVSGPQYWLDQETSFPLGLENVITTPTKWIDVQGLTVDTGITHYAVWRSTASAVIDVYPSGDTRVAAGLVAPLGSLWQQLTTIAEQTILAHPCCDRYDRLFTEVNTQYEPTRTGIVSVMTITKQDTASAIDIERNPTARSGRIELSGISIAPGSNTPFTYFSLAPGHVFKHYGTPDTLDRLLLSSQSQANTLAGLKLAAQNNPFPNFSINTNQNNRMIDICPRQYVTLSIATGDTPRGIVFSGSVIPREISYQYRSGALLTQIPTSEALTVADISITGDTPSNDTIPWPSFPPPTIFPNPVIPPIPVFPPDPTVPFLPIGILGILFPGYGVYVMDMKVPGTWRNATPSSAGWTDATILNTLYGFEMGPTGIIYLSDYIDGAHYAGQIFAQPYAAGSSRSIIYSQSAMDADFPVTNYVGAHAMASALGFDRTIVNGLAARVNQRGAGPGTGGFAMMSPTTGILAATITSTSWNGYASTGPMALSHYLTNWFYAGPVAGAGTGAPDARQFARFNNGLTAIDTVNNVWGTPYSNNSHIHAAAADIIYAANSPTAGSIAHYTAAGTAHTDLAPGVANDFQSYACDPTGTTLIIVAGTPSQGIIKSTDSGLTFGAAMTIPLKDWDNISHGNRINMKIYNLGDANKWLTWFNQTTHIDPSTTVTNLLQIWYTSDSGTTWTEWTGDLTVYVPAASVPNSARSA